MVSKGLALLRFYRTVKSILNVRTSFNFVALRSELSLKMSKTESGCSQTQASAKLISASGSELAEEQAREDKNTVTETSNGLLLVGNSHGDTLYKTIAHIKATASNAAEVAAQGLLAEEVIAIPTDTIYGVAALAQSCQAVRQLYTIKQRNEKKPIAICVADIPEVYKYAKVTVGEDVLRELLPGPVTVVFERSEQLNPELNPHTHLVGVRIPDHALVREICRLCRSPLALTSANKSAEQSSVRIEEFNGLWPSLSVVVDGGLLGQSPTARAGSTVVDLSRADHYNIIRPGSAREATCAALERYGLTNSSL